MAGCAKHHDYDNVKYAKQFSVLMNCLILNPPRRDNIVMVKEGRCMQRKGAWGYIMAPVTMVTIATLLRERGHTVNVMDCPATSDTVHTMLTNVRSFDPHIVFINTSTPTIEDDIYAAACIKEESPNSIATVLFGIHPSCQYKEILQAENGVDYCIIGEPEFAARDLVEALAGGDKLHSTPGIAFLDDKEQLVVTAPREPIKDLDDLPVPDWSFINTENYRLPLNNDKFLLVNTNRGCPYRCIFCNAYVYYGRTPRRHSAGRIMQELHNNVTRFGITNFMFWAEEFILDKNFVRELCQAIIRSGLQIKWVCNSRVDAVDAETLKAIKDAGCWNIAFGIESGDQNILNQINKQTSLEQISHAVTLAKKAGLQVTGHVIIGFPADTYATIATTSKFINSLNLDFVQYYCAMPYPGTQLYNDAVQNSWLSAADWSQWEHNSSVLDYPQLTAREIMKLRRRLMLRWYFTPKRIINTLKNHIKRPSDIWALISKLYGFIRWM
ncbi:MAG: radical SAM protein [Thermodesulfovibrionia bacterium]|nr:radical SAM protein [Thermodesulfovibrionia bacterium]